VMYKLYADDDNQQDIFPSFGNNAEMSSLILLVYFPSAF